MKPFLKFSLFLIIILISFAKLSIALADQAPLSPQQTEQIQKIIHDYIVKNPQLVVDALQTFQQQQRQQITLQTEKAIHTYAKDLLNITPQTPVGGNPNGKVTLIEFFDYQCSYCQRVAPTIQTLIKKNPQLRVIYKELPIYPNSDFISLASLAAVKQNKYQAFHNELIQTDAPIAKEAVLIIAKKIGLDVSKLKVDMGTNQVGDALKSNIKLADSLYITATPSFIVLGNTQDQKNMHVFFVPGAASETVMQKYIQQAEKSK